MTVIAYRNGVMASDSGSFWGDAIIPWAPKLLVGPMGVLIGVSGNPQHCNKLRDAVRSAPPDQPLDWTKLPLGEWEDGGSTCMALMVQPGGDPAVWTCRGYEPFPGAPYIAIGAAQDFALGALHAGASAVQAVEAAIMHSRSAAGPVQSIEHHAASSEAPLDVALRIRLGLRDQPGSMY